MAKIRLFIRSAGLVFSTARWLSISAIVLSLLTSLLPLALIWSLKMLVDAVTAAITTDSYESTRLAMLMVVVIAVIYFLDESLQSLATLIRRNQSYRVEKHMFGLIHGKSVSLDLLHFEKPEYFDILSRAAREAPYRPSSIVNNLILFFRNGISLLLMAGLLATLNGWLLALLVIANIPGVALRLRYADILYNFRKEQSPNARKAAYFNWLLTGERPSRELRLFELGDFFKLSFRKYFDLQKEEELNIYRKKAIVEFVSSLFKALAVLVAIYYIVRQTTGSWITLGDLAMYLLAFRLGMTYLKQLMSSLTGLYEDNLFVSDVFEFLGLEEKVKAEQPEAKVEQFSKGLKVSGLNFRYPGADTDVLKEVNLEIRKGESLALVGSNGAGKTTLVRLLCRLYNPDKGEITRDGINIKHFDPLAYRRRFSVMFQDFMLYNMTAAENILAGDMHNAHDETRVRESARKAGIDELLENLPKGYETVLGRLFDDSRELSWGEWQKIALARSLYRQSDILVLDEPTSSLDAEAEYELFQRFREITRGQTCLLISHRFSNVSIADRIAVLDGGKITEEGSHAELMSKKGTYYSLYMKQKSRYS